MSRKLKNILMLVLIMILVITTCLTGYFANKNNNKLPEMPNEEMNNQNTEPPDKPNEEMDNQSTEPPEKPTGEMDNSNFEENKDFNSNMEMPQENMNETLEMPKDMINQDNLMPNINNNLSIVYYVLFVLQSLCLSLLIMYLVMSNFNKKNLKETFISSDKIIIYVLSIIILTTSLTLIESYITKNIFKNSNIQNLPNNIENSDIAYSGVKEITEDTEITSGKYESNKSDENVILVSEKINATIENISIEKTGDSDSGDNTSFYGINSAILAKSGAILNIKNINVTTDAVGANGVFSYGGSATTNNTSSDGTTINISDSTITTKKDNSGGIMTTGGGITNAYNLTINTSGISSAAIRTDRGGGTVNVDGGTYTTNGSGSPAIYSTAEIIVKNASLVSKVAEGIIVEGKNSVVIENCDLIDSNTKLNGLSTTYKNIFLYQSMSGDADTGNSSFTATNSKITTNNGDTFYVTNTSSTINLTNNTIVNNDEFGNFLRIQADSWGNNGSNGGEVNLILTNQIVKGNIVVDNISTLDIDLKENSYYEGVINSSNSAKSLNLKLDETSNIKLTGDSYVNSLDNSDSSNSNIDFNGYKLYVNGVVIN